MSLHRRVPNPSTRTNISPRLDYQVTATNTLTVRYQFEQEGQSNAGLGTTSLPSLAFSDNETENTLQISDSQNFGVHVVNDTALPVDSGSREPAPQTAPTPPHRCWASSPAAETRRARRSTDTDHYELQNYTYISHGKHYMRFGARVRVADDSSFSNSSFQRRFYLPVAGGL